MSEKLERRQEVRLRRSRLLHNPLEKAITYKIATTQSDFEQAFGLVWRRYIQVRLQADDGIGIRFTKYHLLPSTKVFVARFRKALLDGNFDQLKSDPGQMVGTLSFVADTPLGLPSDEICRTKIGELRAQGSRCAEVIALGVEPEFRDCKVMVFLYKLMFEYARLEGITDLLCAVTKRHIDFYHRMLLFEPMGELTPYAAGNNEEVQVQRLNLERARNAAEQVYGALDFDANLHAFFFTSSGSRELGRGTPWAPETTKYFLEERTSMLKSLSPETLDAIRSEYTKEGCAFPY
jgi:hypothetical protein